MLVVLVLGFGDLDRGGSCSWVCRAGQSSMSPAIWRRRLDGRASVLRAGAIGCDPHRHGRPGRAAPRRKPPEPHFDRVVIEPLHGDPVACGLERVPRHIRGREDDPEHRRSRTDRALPPRTKRGQEVDIEERDRRCASICVPAQGGVPRDPGRNEFTVGHIQTLSVGTGAARLFAPPRGVPTTW